MAQIKTTKTDPVRPVLAVLINETQTPYTPDNIIREFRATDDKRRPERELLLLLESISFKRAKYREVLNEIETILERKDPMYALIVFAERISAKPLSSKRAQKSSSLNDIHVNMPLPKPPKPLSKSSSGVIANMHTTPTPTTTTTNASITLNNNNHRQPPMAPPPPASLTSTPLTSRSSDGRNKELSSFGASTIFGARAPYDSRSDLSQIKQRVLNAVSNGSDEKYDRTMKHKQVIYRAAIPEASNDSTETNNASITNTSVDPVVPSTSTNGSNGACGALVEVPPYPLCPAFPTEKNNNDLVQYKEGLPDDDRVNSLWDFNDMDAQNTLPARKLNALPLYAQENVLVEDLLYVLVGVRGSYIWPMPREDNGDGNSKYETRFGLHSEMDKSFAELIKEILPLASHYMGIQLAIANTSGRGQVINALNAHLTEYTKEYYHVIASAETEHTLGQMTLAKLQYYLQPTTWIMSAIYNFVIEMQMNDCQGAAVLSLLDKHIKRLGGDKRSQGALIELATATAVPYMKMLQIWIQKGIIVDRMGEFLVEDNEVIHMGELPEHYSDDYWERRYTVREKSIPKFLAGLADKILRTGKYLNVIRQCGKRQMPVQTMNLEYDPTNDKLVSVINDAYHFAARMLLDVLLTENDLMGHLSSVKRYLLLHQGDFIMQFMDASEDELSKNVDQVLPITLENLLGLTLRLSSARGDPYKDNVHCGLLTYDLVTQMSKIIKPHEETWKSNDRLDLSGMECFAFSYEVKWPVSLVLNHIAISKYQMLFRQLFYCKHVERQLCKIWKENSLTKKFSPQSAKLYRSAFTLRQRMMDAIQNLEYYMMIEIIEPNWHVFIEKMKKVENVDMVLKLHHDFLDLCLKNCMLSETSHLNRAIFKLCKICLKFCEFIQRSQRFFLDAELKSMVCDSGDENTDQSDTEPDISDRLQTESKMDESDTFGERVKRFDLEFTGMLITFLKQINDLAKDNTTDLFMNLVHRINFNGFYSDQMEKLCVSKAMG